jgi:hypothetical protein
MDKRSGQFGGSAGLFPFRTLSLNAHTVGFINSVKGKGVGSPVSTAWQRSPKLYTSVFLGWNILGSFSPSITSYTSGAINMVLPMFIVCPLYAVGSGLNFVVLNPEILAIQNGSASGAGTGHSEGGL